MLGILISQQSYEVDNDCSPFSMWKQARSLIMFKEMSKVITRLLKVFHNLAQPVSPASCCTDLLSPAFYSHSLILPDSVQMSLPPGSFPSPLPRHSVQGRVTCSVPRFPQVPYNFFHHLVLGLSTLYLLPLREGEFSDCGDLDFFLFNLSIQDWTHHRCSINGYLKAFNFNPLSL